MEENMWKKISSKIILQHPRLTVIEDEVELPTGERTSYIRFDEVNRAVTVIAVREDGKMAVEKEYSYPPDKVLYQLPGGSVGKEEDILVGANRELMEEVGVRANKLKEIGSFYFNNRRSAKLMHVVLAKELTKQKLDGDSEEVIAVEWLSEEEVAQLISKREIKNVNMLAAWALFRSSPVDEGDGGVSASDNESLRDA